jgi:hypothetical protein
MVNTYYNFTQAATPLAKNLTPFQSANVTVYPNVGDKITLRTEHEGKPQTFLCIERRFDLSEEAMSIHFLFDVCP